MKFFRAASFGLIMAFCAACAHFEPDISPAAEADKSSAILYGRFCLKHTDSGDLKIAFWLQNVDTQKPVYICFDASQPLRVIQVKPGHYQIAGYLATNRGHEDLSQRCLIPTGPGVHITQPFMAAAGSQIYLGDYAGEATLDGDQQHWQIYGITNNFTASSVEYREKYPKLLNAPVVSLFALIQAGQ